MKTIPKLTRMTSISPGVHLNYGGSRGTLFAIPLFRSDETYSGRAVLFGTAATTFVGASLNPEQTFLISDVAFLLPPLLEMVCGLSSLEVGCLAVDGEDVLVAARGEFDDFIWINVSTGKADDIRSYRHFFRSWTMVAKTAEGVTPLFQWPNAPST